MKIMATGSRHMGVCEHPGGREHPCTEALRHRYVMDRAMREHVHPLARRRATLTSVDPTRELANLRGVALLELYHGDAEGADRLAASYWEHYTFGPVHAVPANWAELGSRAGHVRNGLLVARMPEFVLAFPWQAAGGQWLSQGTRDAIRQAMAAGIPVHPYPLREICSRIRRTA